ncbi:osmoprotectant transport system substrate-binding protein [Alteribacillus persepolensis]|uniref:Osmoprotectant transport system substrate-binding protein n=1 Tax=Alteribacillus persepolensis TaxID=568899 RepID=A0A1G8IT98_9BACI|nr:osmoprotectant ABC transporter substrate-binding protein [Alteribacillus persepolensis]SDI22275.1 osmoprotectant transport system substrate-binding protein [Alteribacillus persepolensis]
MKKKLMNIFAAFALLTASGCALPGLSGPSEQTVRIGTLGTAESEILGEMLSIMIERNTELNTEMVTQLGSSILQHQGMTTDDLDITSTRYTGTDLSGALGMDPITDPDKAMDIVQTEFDERFNQTWAESYGFENSYSVAVTQEFAEENDIETVSDLEPYAEDLRFGVDNAWVNREGDGYDGFTETYFPFGEVFPMSVGLVYQAAASGHMDVVLAYSSDGRIKEFDLKVLEDDRQFFPPYDTSPVIQNEVLKQYPEIQEITNKLAGEIPTEKMQELNYLVDVKLQNPEQVARDFLEENNYFEGSEGGNG